MPSHFYVPVYTGPLVQNRTASTLGLESNLHLTLSSFGSSFFSAHYITSINLFHLKVKAFTTLFCFSTYPTLHSHVRQWPVPQVRHVYVWTYRPQAHRRPVLAYRLLEYSQVTLNFLAHLVVPQKILKFLRVRIRCAVCALLGVEYSVSRQKDCRKFDSNGSTTYSSDKKNWLRWVEQIKNRHAIHPYFPIFILFTSDIACQVRNSVTEMSKGPTGGIIFGHFRHAIRPFYKVAWRVGMLWVSRMLYSSTSILTIIRSRRYNFKL
jgi:hypothetical protein